MSVVLTPTTPGLPKQQRLSIYWWRYSPNSIHRNRSCALFDQSTCSYVGAVTEILTGREEDMCLDDPRRGESDYSTGEAKEDMGVARMDIYDSELACETIH